MKLLIPLIVILVALAAMVAKTPAAYLTAEAIPDAAPVTLYEVSGTIADGRIGRASIKNVDVDDIEWSLAPGDLLGLALGADARAEVLGSTVSGHVRAGLLTPFAGTEIRAATTLSQIKTAAKIPFMPIEGKLFARIDTVTADTQWLTGLVGQIQLVDSVWALGNPKAPLGEFQADLSMDEDGIITADFHDVAATVKVEGQLTLSPDRSYAVSARLRSTPDTPTVVSNNMRALGRPDPEGWYTLNYSGRLR